MVTITPKWHEQSARWGHPLHSMCSYLAMFPPRLPHYFIERFTRPGEVVIDGMGGRGTTPTQACLTGRVGIGNDLNPLAYTLIKAKVDPPNKKALIRKIKELEEGFTPTEIYEVPEKIQMLYTKKTLQQLVYLKENLNIRRKIDTFIMGIILGGMHGDSTLPSYMSIPMPNTFSMSPNYVKKYIKKNSLRPPKHDAFDVIRHRTERLYSKGMPGIKGKAFNEDIRNLPKKLKDIKGQLIVSSPPYLKVVKYGKFNWIRLWMLDTDPKELDMDLDDTHSLPRYLEFIEDSLNSMYKLLDDEGICVLAIGDVFGDKGIGKNKKINLAKRVWDELGKESGFELISIIDDKYKKDSKVSRIWGKTKGVATEIDRLLVLSKDKSKLSTIKSESKIDWTCNYPDRFSNKATAAA